MKSAPISTKEQKLAFLKRHEHAIRDAVPAHLNTLLAQLGKEMKDAGLYRTSTYIVDIVSGLRKRVIELGWAKT